MSRPLFGSVGLGPRLVSPKPVRQESLVPNTAREKSPSPETAGAPFRVFRVFRVLSVFRGF